MWQYHPLLIVFSLGGLLSFAIAGYCFRYMRTYGTSYLVASVGLLAFNNGVWLVAATFKTASTKLATTVLFYKLEFLGSAVNPSVAVVLALAYVGYERYVSRRLLVGLAVVPVATILLVFLNPNNLMITDPVLLSTQGILAFEHSFTPLFVLYLAWALGAASLAAGIIAYGGLKRKIGVAPSLVGSLVLVVPIVVVGLKVGGIYPPGGKGINVTPAVNALSITLVGVAIVRYRIFELLPLGRYEAIDVLQDGYLLADSDGTVVDSNPAAGALLLGESGASLSARPLDDVVPVAAVLEAPSGTAEFTCDDRVIEVRWSDVVQQDDRAGHVLLLQDVTEQRERKRELQRYERIVEHVPVGVYRYTAEPDSELLFANSALVDIFDASSKEELNRHAPGDLYVDSDEWESLTARLRTAGEVTDENVRMQTVDGDTFWASVSESRVDEGEETYFESVVTDITERKEYERELERTRERVQTERDGKETVRRLLLRSATDEEIAESVCQLLVDAYGYECARVVQEYGDAGDRGRDAVSVARYGDDHGFWHDETADCPRDVATQRVLAGEASVTVTAESDRDAELVARLRECSLHSVRSIRLEHDGIAFGALTVVRSEPGSDLSQDLVDEVAAAMAFKQQVNRQQEAMVAESVVELDVRVTDADHFLVALSSTDALSDVHLEAHELSSDGDDGVEYLVEVDGDDPAMLEAAATEVPSVSETTLVTNAESPVVNVCVDPPTFGSVLTPYGGVIQSVSAHDGRVDLTVSFPRRTDVGAVVEAVREHWPDAEMRTRRERTVDRTAPTVFESLTDKQEEALRTATVAGFFDRPQRANASDVAELLGVSRSTFLHHLRNAERKVFEEAFDGTDGADNG
jgi:PAS domain S-box-containing protein